MPQSEGRGPLHGLTVVEFSTSVAAPFAGMILAELGAEVLKVENPEGGDDARRWGPPFVDGVAPVFSALNRNKRSLTVNLKVPADRDRLRALIIDRADIVVQNMRPGLVEKFGFDAATLRSAKPELIFCNLHAYGATGPKRGLPGYDPLMQAYGGIMSVTGHEGEEPVRVGPSLVDQGAGMWAVIGVLAALQERAATGTGGEVGTSLYETALAWMTPQVATYLASGKPPKRIGSENPGIAPYRAFEATDGWLIVAAGNDNLFRRLARALGHPELAEDARFTTNPDRVENRRALNAILQDIIATGDRDSWLNRLEEAGVPCAPVLALDEVVQEEQFRAIGMLQEDPDGRMQLLGAPLSFDGVRPAFRSRPPRLGEANELLAPSEDDTGTAP